jgi:hypothetical protein
LIILKEIPAVESFFKFGIILERPSREEGNDVAENLNGYVSKKISNLAFDLFDNIKKSKHKI